MNYSLECSYDLLLYSDILRLDLQMEISYLYCILFYR